VAPCVRRFAGDAHAIGQISRSLQWNVQCAQADVEQSCGIPLSKERVQDTRGERRYLFRFALPGVRGL